MTNSSKSSNDIDIRCQIDAEEVNKETKKCVVSPSGVTPSATFIKIQKKKKKKNIFNGLIKFSNYPKILRITSYVLRFTQKMKKLSTAKGQPTVEETVLAEKYLLRHV